MKIWQWLLLALAGYEALVGVGELSTVISSNPLANAVVGFPSVGQSLYTTSVVSSIQVGGGVDLAVSAMLFFVAMSV